MYFKPSEDSRKQCIPAVQLPQENEGGITREQLKKTTDLA